MELPEYVIFVGQKMKEAYDRADTAEVIRLSELLIKTLEEKIKDLESFR